MSSSTGHSHGPSPSGKESKGSHDYQPPGMTTKVFPSYKTHTRNKSDSAVTVNKPNQLLPLSLCSQHGNTERLDTGLPSLPSQMSTTTSPSHMQNVKSQVRSPWPASSRYHTGNVTGSDSRVTTPDHMWMSQSFSVGNTSSSPSPDSFAYQTKYLVLQYLHQATNEEHVLQLSQNSVSAASESEHQCKSYANTLRRQWQSSRSRSSPSFLSNQRRPKQKLLTKTKSCSKSRNANHSKNISSQIQDTSSKNVWQKSEKTKKKPSKLKRQNPVEAVTQGCLIHSNSQNTDNSEHDTYDSDADDELDTSFNSSHQGSVTSLRFENALTFTQQQGHTNRLPTIKSEGELIENCQPTVGDSPLNEAQEFVAYACDDETASSILSLDMISLEHQPVSPTTQYARINDYLLQMSRASVESFQFGDPTLSDSNHRLSGNEEEKIDRPIFHLPDSFDDSEEFLTQNQNDDKSDHITESSDDQLEVEGASGDLCVDEVDHIGEEVLGAEASVRSDLADPQDTAFLIDAVHCLQQEIEEEMFTFESEYEEALQSTHSDHSWHSHAHGLSHSCSFSSDLEETVRILARIGDEVQQRHFAHLDKAVGKLLLQNCAGYFTYENFRGAASQILKGDLHGWEQVAILLLYSQQVALRVTHMGREGLHKIIDYTVKLLADRSSDFIIRQGGWLGVASTEPSSEPSTPDHPGPVLNPYLGPYSSITSTTNNTSSTNNFITSTNNNTTTTNITTTNNSTIPIPITSAVSNQQDLEFQSPSHSLCQSQPSSILSNQTLVDTSDLTLIAEETGSQLEEEVSLASIVSSVEAFSVGSAAVSQMTEESEETKLEEIQTEMEEEVESREEVPSSVRNGTSSFLTKCAVSIGVLAVGGIVAFRLARGT